jgi:cation diffusion facilitator CzcD-associated flavoprotein CzcO
MPPLKSIAIIGAGPAGAITVDALAQEQAFDTIRVFERREKAGGCWSVSSSPLRGEHTFLTTAIGSMIPQATSSSIPTSTRSQPVNPMRRCLSPLLYPQLHHTAHSTVSQRRPSIRAWRPTLTPLPCPSPRNHSRRTEPP